MTWENVDFDTNRIAINSSLVRGELTTTKTRKSRRVSIPPSLSEALFDLLAERGRECLTRGWKAVPNVIFCSTSGGHWGERNFNRVWEQVRRKAQTLGVRPLTLHSTRHTYASRAAAGGKSILWVSRQLGHSSPEHTLRRYIHLLPQEEVDLSFAEISVPKRPDTALPHSSKTPNKNTPDLSGRGRYEKMERETGLEPATLSLGS